MSTRPLLICAFCLFTVCLSHSVSALTDTPRIDERQELQKERIDRGRASGRLTPGELRALNTQQKRISRAEKRAKSDGVVTRQERIRLKQRQHKAHQAIFRGKHNRLK